jgi:succinyl-CoA synthetase beta subunit
MQLAGVCWRMRASAPSQLPSSAYSSLNVNKQVVIKSQILAGGRGLGHFTNGLNGGVHIVSKDEATALAAKMLGQTLVTKQTGAKGKPVNTLLISEKMQLKREMYLALLLDRKSAGPMMIGCSEGGTSIEDLAEKFPDKIIKIPIDIKTGITDEQAMKVGGLVGRCEAV